MVNTYTYILASCNPKLHNGTLQNQKTVKPKNCKTAKW